MLLQCLWTALPSMILAQTYYMSFVFNNNRLVAPAAPMANGSQSQDGSATGPGNNGTYLPMIRETMEVSHEEGHAHAHSDSYEVIHSLGPYQYPEDTDESSSGDESLWPWPPAKPSSKHTTTTDSNEMTEITTPKTTTKEGDKLTPAAGPTTTPATTTPKPLGINTSTEATTRPTDNSLSTPEADGDWPPITPHPPNFFDYPNAKCHEEMNLHELFGLSLQRDRGLPVKILCNFSNEWAGPWLLMNRMELPARLHMRHWFFGYITEDYKDLNTNFLALAHIMNHMRLAMLIIGQDNNNELVYNLYDDVVISGFNDLFMLRKAHLVAANTTDLLFISVGDVLETYTGRNRSCPFQVLGAWWGHHLWHGDSETFCVFPVDRDTQRPGYMAIFIKPSPFAVNNTASYGQAITTRRPWATTVNAALMVQAGHDKRKYKELQQKEFLLNKNQVMGELQRRSGLYRNVEEQRKAQGQRHERSLRAIRKS